MGFVPDFLRRDQRDDYKEKEKEEEEGSHSSPVRKNSVYRKSFGAKTMSLLLNLFVSHEDKMSFNQNVKHKARFQHKERFSSVMQEMLSKSEKVHDVEMK